MKMIGIKILHPNPPKSHHLKLVMLLDLVHLKIPKYKSYSSLFMAKTTFFDEYIDALYKSLQNHRESIAAMIDSHFPFFPIFYATSQYKVKMLL